jgi:hypothetical protein
MTMIVQKLGTSTVTGQYMGTHFKEVLSYQFIYDVYKNDVKSLVEKDFMKEIIKHLLGTYQEQIDSDIRTFKYFVLALIVNVLYIHVGVDDCPDYFCLSTLSSGRNNYWLIALRSLISLFVLNIMREEFTQYKKKGSMKEYFAEIQNIFDFGVQVTFVVAASLDTQQVASDWCLIFYALNFFCVSVVYTYQLKLYPEYAPYVVMITEGIKDVNFFVMAQSVLCLIFSCIFYIFGIQTEDDDGYSSLGLWGTFLMTFREGMGDFGNIHASGITSDVLLVGESICWFILVLSIFVLFANFMIAQVSWTFERVKSEQ